MEKLKYNINDIYYYKKENVDLLIEIEPHQYKSLISNNIFKYDSIQLDSLNNLINICGLEMLLLTKEGIKKQYLNESDIRLISECVNKLNNLNFFEIRRIELCSNKLSSIITSLLGINVTYKNERMKDKYNLKDVIISAKKETIFKNKLNEFIKTSFLIDSEIMIENDKEYLDYRVLKALMVSNIDNLDGIRENNFVLSADIFGNLNINGEQISQANNDKNLQKRIKF